MELAKCACGNSSFQLANHSSKACLLSCGAPVESASQEYALGKALLLYVTSLSGTTIRLPGIAVDFYLGDYWAISELLLTMFIGITLLVVCAYVAYCCNTSVRLPPTTRRTLIVGLAVGVAMMPFIALSLLGPRSSKVANFTASLLGVVGCFRLIELTCRTGPKGFDSSCGRFVLYVASPIEVVFDGEGRVQQAPKGHLTSCSLSCVGHFWLLVFTLSLGKISDFKPLLSGQDPLEMGLFGFPVALPAVYLQAIYVYACLTSAMQSFRVSLALAGVDTYEPMRHPLLLSTSVREFWGRRWNLLIHRLMHRSFFAPLAARSPGPRAGAIAAFAVSGLFHEYMWLATNWHAEQYAFGGPLKFFFVQFVLMTMENVLKRTLAGKFVSALPSPILTILTTLVILPFGPLFLDGLAGMMSDSLILYPHF